jgi:cytochrome P450
MDPVSHTADEHARAEAASMPLELIDVSKPRRFADDSVRHHFTRLRRDDPVHWTVSPVNGGFWSVTRYHDIMAVDTDPRRFSSDWTRGGIGIFDPPREQRLPMFIAMDPPRHDEQRKVVSPIVAPANLARLEGLIRERTARVLDGLPRGETFDWVDRVSIELTTLMLATLFDFPLEDRRLIVGGNDTTRNSMTGGVLALHRHPREWRKLRADPGLIASMVPEIIRWQTPLAHMRRTALVDTELGGKAIREGDKVVMWYYSGNRDETVIDEPEAFIIDRPRPRQHLSFGFGIHRCVGNRLAEMQLRILWEEILPRFPAIEVVGPPRRVLSNFVRGYTELPVRIPA